MKSEEVLCTFGTFYQPASPSLNLFTITGCLPLKAVVVRQEGLEPPTYCLEGSCSIQLSYWRISMERVTGIGPAYPAWKAGVLPLNYTRKSYRVTDSSRRF